MLYKNQCNEGNGDLWRLETGETREEQHFECFEMTRSNFQGQVRQLNEAFLIKNCFIFPHQCRGVAGISALSPPPPSSSLH